VNFPCEFNEDCDATQRLFRRDAESPSWIGSCTQDACAIQNAAERRFSDDVLMKRDEDKIEITIA